MKKNFWYILLICAVVSLLFSTALFLFFEVKNTTPIHSSWDERLKILFSRMSITSIMFEVLRVRFLTLFLATTISCLLYEKFRE
jgi:magnesium-transporting ATPase (P-type)